MQSESWNGQKNAVRLHDGEVESVPTVAELYVSCLG
jgi:hypothetical protein